MYRLWMPMAVDNPSEEIPFEDESKARENVHLYLYGPDGELKQEQHTHNLITWVGEQHIADQMSDQGDTAMSHMAVGSGSTAATSGDTTLAAEVDRNALSGTTQGGGGANNDVRYEGYWAAGDGTGALVEAGILNASSGGTLLARTVFSVINKGASDTLIIRWDIAFDDDGV